MVLGTTSAEVLDVSFFGFAKSLVDGSPIKGGLGEISQAPWREKVYRTGATCLVRQVYLEVYMSGLSAYSIRLSQ